MTERTSWQTTPPAPAATAVAAAAAASPRSSLSNGGLTEGRHRPERREPVSWATDVATQFMTTAAQLLNAVSTWRRTADACSGSSGSLLLRASPFFIFCWSAAGLCVALCAPRFHMRHR